MSYASKVIELDLEVLDSPQQYVEQVVACMSNGGWLLCGSYVLNQVQGRLTRVQMLHLVFVRKAKAKLGRIPCPACGGMR